MITIQSGKLTIPEEDRFVGFAGDNLGRSKAFVLLNHGEDSGSYTLCLRFDDDSVRVIPLSKSVSDGNLILTWDILSTHLLKPGIVMAQIKSVGSGDVVLHTSCDYFVVAESAVSDDDNAADYVLREEMEERMAAMLSAIRASAPYIGEDGYWYLYDVVTDSYVRGVKAVGEITIDKSMIPGSANPVASNAISAYVESAVSAKVGKNTTIAGLPLSGNISRADLVNNLSGTINPPLVTPDVTVGYGGQFGKTYDGKPAMCRLANSWVKLATEDDLSGKMDLAPDVYVTDIDTVPAGQLFVCQEGVALKKQNGYVELARVNNVYSKYDIDLMIGNLEVLLSNV